MGTRIFGNTGLTVSRLGIGLAEIGFELTLEEINTASNVLNTALDAGITFLDTSACYDISEELIGRTIAHRRDEYTLATKAGHVTGGYVGESWTAQTVRDSIDRSLVRMKTDHLDLVQLHSCNVDVLERGEVIAVLQQAKQVGKTRFIGYSGDNEAALWAVAQMAIKSAEVIIALYGERVPVNMDILISGGILRDVGKLVEYEEREPGVFVQTAAGKMLRHPFTGVELAARCGLPVEVQHIIAAHAEEGDKVKRTTEATIVNHADFISFHAVLRLGPGKNLESRISESQSR